MADVSTQVRNADAPWNSFESDDYWRRNYHELQAEDQEIISKVSRFFIRTFAKRPRVRYGIDVGSGTNLYPALLMLPWTEQILLTDYSVRNVGWLRHHLGNDSTPWTWRPFWAELQGSRDYGEIGDPRQGLLEACDGDPGLSGIEQRSVFDLPPAVWDIGTMFFVAESITEDHEEFRNAIACFLGALKPGSPFAAAFMAGSDGYPVADNHYPALPVSRDDVERHLRELRTGKLSVELLQTKHRVRDGYHGMIVATGFTHGR